MDPSSKPPTSPTPRGENRSAGVARRVAESFFGLTQHSYIPETKLGRICVFASSSYVSEEAISSAYRLGKLIGEHGYDLVYGGSNIGLMGATAQGTKSTGKRVIGVLPGVGIPEQLGQAEWGVASNIKRSIFEINDETIGAGSLQDRKIKMLRISDGVIALPGGLGTFDELATTLELRRRGSRGAETRAALVNSSGIYEGLRQYLNDMYMHDTSDLSADQLLYFADTVDSAVAYVTTAIDQATTPSRPPKQ